MSRPSSKSDPVSAEDALRHIASSVGAFIGRKLALRTYDFVSASGLHCWRAFIAEPGMDFVAANHFSWVPGASSRHDAAARLLGHCFSFFKVDSVEELDLKLAVLGRRAVMNMLGLKERA